MNKEKLDFNSKNKTNNKNREQKVEPPKKRILSFELYIKVLRHLQERYPKCFTKPPKPLAIGILKEAWCRCKELEITKGQLQQFFHRYCGKEQYKQGLVVGAERVDLEGNVKNVVTEKEVAFLKQNPSRELNEKTKD